MPFNFRLSTLLRVRQRMLELAEMELAKAVNKKRLILKELNDTKVLLERERQELKKSMGEGIMSSEFHLRVQLISQLEEKIKKLDIKLKKSDVEIAQAKGNLKQRHTDYELVKSLRDRQLKKYLEEVDRNLQKELDELVSLKHARVRSEVK